MQDHPLFEDGDIAVYEEADPTTGYWTLHPVGPDGAPLPPVLLYGFHEYLEDVCAWNHLSERHLAQARDKCWIHYARQVNEQSLLEQILVMFGAADAHVRETGDVWISDHYAGDPGHWLSAGDLRLIADELRRGHAEHGWLKP